MKYLRNKLNALPDPAKTVLAYMFKVYIGWSICADLLIIGGIVYLIFFWWGWIGIDRRSKDDA